MCNWVTMPYSRKLSEHCKPAIMKKIKIIILKKYEIMPFAATWMKLETLIVSEVSQKEKDKYHMMSLISGI